MEFHDKKNTTEEKEHLVIEVTNLSKQYGTTKAVDDITFSVQSGKVTGFLGPNGAGKSTTMRLIAGLDRPTAGRATVNGRPIVDHAAPLREVGFLLDAKHLHPGRTARSHLRALAATHGIGDKRVEEVISLTGLESVAGKRAGKFSLGMGQRLGIAGALLGDPATLVMDEPINGLDPDGVIWVRKLVRHLAAEGRTVFLSSHLMSEMALAADHLIVIGRGRILADSPIADVLAGAEESRVIVRTPSAAALAAVLAAPHVTVTTISATELEIVGMDAPAVSAMATGAGIVLHELSTRSASLEDAYLSLTKSAVEYQATELQLH